MTSTGNSHFSSLAHTTISDTRRHLQCQLVGLEALVDRLLIALLTGGHILIEGPPGVAKTRTIKQFAERFALSFVRIQATPDLLPSDITGTDIYQQNTGEFTFLPGPLFHQIVLFDEVNRAPPKVQSALLEAMGEQQITTGGITRPLAKPFLVAATQNPIEHEGTYPLPEAQLDRFMFFVSVDLPGIVQERDILDQVLQEHQDTLNQSLSPAASIDASCLQDAQQQIGQVHISDAIRDYIVRLTGATRGLGPNESIAQHIQQAASPRASINLAIAAQAFAWLNQRDHVLPEDISLLAPDIYSGRITLDYRARAEGKQPRQVIEALVNATTCV